MRTVGRITTVLGALLALGVATIFVRELPGMRRYLRMRAM
jgi:hypothetical protein